MTLILNDFPAEVKNVKNVLEEINSLLIDDRENESIIYWIGDIDRRTVTDFYISRRSIIENGFRHKIILVLNSAGGDIDAAYSLCRILRSCCKCLEIIVPLWAKSAATLLCLAADKILMTPIAELGPLDVQVKEPGEVFFKGALDEYQATMQVRQEAFSTFDHAVQLILHRSGGMAIRDILKPAADFVSKLVSPLYSQIDPAKLGKRARQLDIGYQYATRILGKYCNYDEYQCDQIASRIVYDYPSHSFAINFDELESLQLNVELIEHIQLDLLIALISRLSDFSLIGSLYELDGDIADECTCEDEEYYDIAREQVAVTNETPDVINDSKEDTRDDEDMPVA